jgi:hypothetical protein
LADFCWKNGKNDYASVDKIRGFWYIFALFIQKNMLKKTIILTFAIAIAVSPLLPRVFADSGEWKQTVANAVWDYGTYRIERVALESDAQGPFQFDDAVFLAETSESCESVETCKLVDMTMLKDGKSFGINDVDDRVTDAFWHSAQDERFVFMVPSESDSTWGTAFEYNSQNGTVATLADITRATNGLSFMTFAVDGDRIYTSTLQKEKNTGEVGSALSVYDYGSGFSRNDFTYSLTAPWQEIVDVHDGLALVRFEFSGGFEQLWLIDQTKRSMEAIPDTWTENGGDIVGAHFLSDGSVRYFRNYRLWSFMPDKDETPVDAGGAFLSWFAPVQEAVQIDGDRMAYIDDENGLYLSDARGVRKLGVALNGVFNLTSDTLYFQNLEGEYVGYDFDAQTFETRNYHVTDSQNNVFVGVNADGNVWYENTSNNTLLNIGYGGAPVLSDAQHAYWRGSDGNIYEATFSPILDLERPHAQAFAARGSTAVYLVSGESIWFVPNPEVYFTWFDSWDDIVRVSQPTINAYLTRYENKGDLKFAVGTRVKSVASPRVYVVGTDHKLHWIVSEHTAFDIYGANWNKGIITVGDTYLWQYAKGVNVETGDDIKEI